MRFKMSKKTRRELADANRERYRSASRNTKSRILDEFVESTGYNRRYAMALLSRSAPFPESETKQRRRRKHTYTTATLRALEKVWDLSNCLCSKCLVAYLPDFLIALERHGRLSFDAFTRSQLLTISPATVDRHLAEVRRGRRKKGLSATRPGTLLKRQIPIKHFREWQDAKPGFCEVDVVVHTDDLSGGNYLSSLVLTDVATGWTECRPLLYHDMNNVCAALHDIRHTLPFPLLGISTDNGREFINRMLLAWCNEADIRFTRGRPYKKNDQAHVEQKNGHIVRRIVGHDCFSGMRAYQRLKALYERSNQWVNFFQPSQKLLSTERDGSRVHKTYAKAATPYRRVLESPDISDEHKKNLQVVYDDLDPIALLKYVRAAQRALAEVGEFTSRKSDS